MHDMHLRALELAGSVKGSVNTEASIMESEKASFGGPDWHSGKSRPERWFYAKEGEGDNVTEGPESRHRNRFWRDDATGEAARDTRDRLTIKTCKRKSKLTTSMYSCLSACTYQTYSW